jgi:transcriptional regulator of acetoin/glycerol metabolism
MGKTAVKQAGGVGEPYAAAPRSRRYSVAPSPDGRLADIEQRAILHTLSACAGNMSAAARQLGISRATLYRRLRGAAA